MDDYYVIGISFTSDTPKLSDEEIARRLAAAGIVGGPILPAGRPGMVWGCWIQAPPTMDGAAVSNLVGRACSALDIRDGADIGWTAPKLGTPDEIIPQAKA
jgi:hypothetical protein